MEFEYRADDEESMLEALRYSLEVTKEVMLSIFEEVESLETAYEFYEKYQPQMVTIYEGEKNGILYGNFEYKEGLLNFLLLDSEQFITILEQRAMKRKEIERKQIELGLRKDSPQLQEEMKKRIKDSRGNAVRMFTSMRDNPVEYAKILKEAERRKTHNTEVLRGYGLDV